MDFWLFPGALVSVNAPTKVTMVAAAPGEVPPAGAMVIPTQSALPPPVALMRQMESARESLQTKAAEVAAMAQSLQLPSEPKTAPWEVTFTEKKA